MIGYTLRDRTGVLDDEYHVTRNRAFNRATLSDLWRHSLWVIFDHDGYVVAQKGAFE